MTVMIFFSPGWGNGFGEERAGWKEQTSDLPPHPVRPLRGISTMLRDYDSVGKETIPRVLQECPDAASPPPVKDDAKASDAVFPKAGIGV